MHRNTLSFPIPHSSDRRPDQSRLSVNVNVAVGIDGPFGNQTYDQRLREEEPEVIQSEDEIDSMRSVHSDKGFAMKVAVRLRPFVESEVDTRNDISVIEMNGNTVRIVNSDNDNYNRTEFGFDVCLNSSDKELFEFADQDQVYHRMGLPLLEKALEGYNVCLFAYGQTGSGKSFTMMGSETNPGIIPRFVQNLYRRMSSLPDVFYAVEVSYYEIYNEKIYDLLSDDKNHNKKILRIREHPQTGPYVENLSLHTVDNFEEVMRCVRNGSRRRATASTASNVDSSRSHSIFTIILSQLRNNCDEVDFDMSSSCGSRINLIDLAGSERHFAMSGDRLKEGSMINKSLLNLGKVISKLADYSVNPTKGAHIPYRDSALTWLLKESLGGNSQTSMIATISPAKCHLEETLSTLRYAATARRIVNYVHINEDPKTKKIRELMEIISDLKARQRQESEPKMVAESHSTRFHSKCLTTDIEPKVIEKISKSTNTSFIAERRVSTKETETSFREPVVEPKIKKATCSISTNTSYIETKPKTQTISTSPIKGHSKPKTAGTSTSTDTMVKRVDSATETSFIEGPTAYDLLRAQKLEEEQQLLAAELRRYREKLLSDRTDCEETKTLKQTRDEMGERSDITSSDDYYDCEQSLESNTSSSTNKTFTVESQEQPNEWESNGQTNGTLYATNEQSGQTSNEWATGEDTVDQNEWAQDNWAQGQSDEKVEDKNGDQWAEEEAQSQGETENDCSLDTKVVADSSLEAKNGDEWSEQGQDMTEDTTEEQTTNEWGAQETTTAATPSTDEWGSKETETNEWGTEETNNETNEWTTEETSEQKAPEEKEGDNQWGENQWGDDQTQVDAKDEPKDTGNDWGGDQDQGDSGQVEDTNWGTDDKAEEEAEESYDQSQDAQDSWGDNWDTESNVTIREVTKKEENNDDTTDYWWSFVHKETVSIVI